MRISPTHDRSPDSLKTVSVLGSFLDTAGGSMLAPRALAPLILLLLLLGTLQARAEQDPPVKESERRNPNLTPSDVFAGVGEQLKAVTDSQIKVLQRLINVTADTDPEKPDLLFRMAELYAEQERYYNFKARSLVEKIAQANKAGDTDASAKLVTEQQEYEKREKQWLLEAAKKYIEVANEPKYQDYKRMDQVLFYLAYLLTQVKKEDQARVFFKRLIKDFPKSPYLPHAYLSFGMYFFEARDLDNALKFFDKVLEYPESTVHDYTLYMKGWVYYNREDYEKSMKTFIEVIQRVAAKKEKAGRGDAQLAKESCKDLVRAYSRIGTPEAAWAFFRKHGGAYAATMMKQLSELYAELGKAEAALATRRALEEAAKDIQAVEAGTRLLAKVDEAHTKAKSLTCDFEVVDQEAGKPVRKLTQTFRVKEQKCLFEFTSPADMKGTKVLLLSPTEWYVYLPSFGKVRRIATHVKDKGIFGLTFGIEDYFFNTYSDQYSAALMSESDTETQLFLTPKPGQDPRYAKIEMTVSKDPAVATLLMYYDAKGTLLSTEDRSGYEDQDGVRLPWRIRRTDNTVEGRSTTMLRNSLKVNEEIPDDLFTKRSLDQ